MNKNTLVSLITPTYNHEKYIEQCIESVLGQTYPHWEMIVVDDASTDNTAYIIEKYAGKDKRIRMIRHSRNWGMYRLAESYNQALDFSSGKYISVLEGDDYWPAGKIEKQLKMFINSKIVGTFGQCTVVTASGRTIARDQSGLRPYFRRFFQDYCGSVFEPLLLKPCFIPSVTVMANREALIKTGKFRQPLEVAVVDHPTWLALSLEGPFYGSKQILGYYRKHLNSQSLVRVAETTKKERNISYTYFFQNEKTYAPQKEGASHKKKLKYKMKRSWTKEMIIARCIEARYHLSLGQRLKSFVSFSKGFFSEGLQNSFSPDVFMARLFCLAGVMAVCFRFPLEKIMNRLRQRERSVFQEIGFIE